MKLIDLYVADVGRRLPEKMRPEIEDELRSLLEDMLEDRAKQAGRPADEEMVSAMLREYGPPAKTAASYLPERYLVGPELFPTYLQVLRVVVIVVLVVTAVGFALTFSQSARQMKDLVAGIFEGISGIMQAGIQAVGIITIIFGIIQYARSRRRPDEKGWNPGSLKPLEDTDRVKPGEQIADIVFTLLVIAVFNFFPQLIVVYKTSWGGPWQHFPLLTDAFFHYLPLMTLLWGLDIILAIVLLTQRRWQAGTHIADLALKAGWVMLLVVMLMGPSIVSLPQSTLSGSEISPGELAGIQHGLEVGVRTVLGIILAVSLIDIGKKVWRLAGKKAPILNA